MEIITIGALKGGVGKTAITFNLAAMLAQNNDVLLIDVDPQSNLTSLLGLPISRDDPEHPTVRSIFDPDVDRATGRRIQIPPHKIVKKSKFCPRLDILPSQIQLAEAEENLSSRANRESILKGYIERHPEFFGKYDYILIDTTPYMSIINKNAFYVANSIILVTDSGVEGLQGCHSFMRLWGRIQDDLGAENAVKAMIVNHRYPANTNAVKDIEHIMGQEDKNAFSHLLLKQRLPYTVRVEDAKRCKCPIFMLKDVVGAHAAKGAEVSAAAFENVLEELRERGVI